MIIDSHTHLDVYFGDLIPLEKRIDNLKSLMKKNNISKSIIISSIEEDSNHPSMTELAKLIPNEKDLILIGTASIEKLSKKKIEELERLLKTDKIRGIKLYPGYEKFFPFDKKCESVYNLCEKYDVPVIFHTGETMDKGAGMIYAKPEHIDLLAVNHPKLKIIMAHIGNPWINDTMVVLNRNENVYSDISGLVQDFDVYWIKYYSEEIIKILKWCGGKNKLLFGTDYPSSDVSDYTKKYIDFVKHLKISKEDKDKILSKNAIFLFKL